MHDEYIKGRREALQTEFDENTKKITDLQVRQSWLQGAFAEVSEVEKAVQAAHADKPKKEVK